MPRRLSLATTAFLAIGGVAGAEAQVPPLRIFTPEVVRQLERSRLSRVNRANLPPIVREYLDRKGAQKDVQISKTPAQLSGGGTRRGPTVWEWIDANVTRRITLEGNRRVGLHLHRVEGDEEAFNSLNYFARPGQTFTDQGQMILTGRNVLGSLNFRLNIADNRFTDPSDRRVSLNYQRGPITLDAGDIRAQMLNSNPLLSYVRNVSGLQVGYRSGRFTTRAMLTGGRGAARTVSFQGNNSVGPYYLQSGRVVADSVQVQLNGQPMTLLTDYVINADAGSITFVSRIISPADTLVVTYESYGISSSGTIRGAGMTYDLGRFGRVGVTGMEQITGSSGLGGSVIQRFFGYGTAGAQYWLDFAPVVSTLQVRVNGIPQVQGPPDGAGGDYYLDPNSPFVIVFKRAISTDQQIDVVYVPIRSTNLDGDRRSWGLDYRVPLGNEASYVQLSQATGELRSLSNPQRSTARAVEGRYRLGPWSLRANLTDIPNNFVAVESRGFRRNERASDLGIAYATGPWQAEVGSRNSSVGVFSTVPRNARITSTRATLSRGLGSTGGWSLSHTISDNRDLEATRLDTTSLSTRAKWGVLDSTFGLDLQNGRGPITKGNGTTRGNLTLQTVSINSALPVGDRFSLTSRISVSRVRALGEEGIGRDLGLGLVWRPTSRTSLAVTAVDSDSGQLATLGQFDAGYGVGYGGNGFSGGGAGAGGFGTGGSRYKNLVATFEWAVSPRFSWNLRGTSAESTGSLFSNTRTQTIGLGFENDFGAGTNLSGSVDRTDTTFLSGASQASRTTGWTLGLTGAPKGRVSYSFLLNGLVSGGNSSFAQDSFGLDAALSYRLDGRQRINLSGRSGRSTGLYGQNESVLSLGHSYRIFRNLVFLTSYRWRDVRNVDPFAGSAGAYRSSGLDFELSLDFRY